MGRVLHVISQRPGWTGSGVALDAIVRAASRQGWEQAAILGTPADDPHPKLGDLKTDQVDPLIFEQGKIDFLIPGMSDVMPYPSSRFSSLTDDQVERYVDAWKQHLARAVEATRPDLIHSHHIWLLSSIVKDVCPEIPVVTHCHGTGLRQLELCPALAPRVLAGCRRNARFFALHHDQAELLSRRLDVDRQKIVVLGNGYREDIFNPHNRPPEIGPVVCYAGKLSHAKGLPWLIDACEVLAKKVPGLELHIAGAGAGEEADAIRSRIESLPFIRFHGQLDQAGLAQLMRSSRLFVLPSFYEGLPLVLVEAAACGCRIVSTNLPGVTNQLAPVLGESLQLVQTPRLKTIDEPVEEDLPAFVRQLEEAISVSLQVSETAPSPADLSQMTWSGIFARVESVWNELIGQRR